VLLRREGWPVSVSMVGRILTSLPQRGALRAPGVFRVKRRRGTAGRPWALRKPKDYAVEAPGDLVQLDTMDLRPTPNVVLKQFTARDVVSRWDVIEVHHRATSTAAPLFLDTLQRRLPFPLRAIQVDGGSEFAALFEAAYQQRGLRLFVLPPRSPKLNGRVERANVLTPRNSMRSMLTRSPSPSSTENSKPGNELTIPSDPIRLWDGLDRFRRSTGRGLIRTGRGTDGSLIRATLEAAGFFAAARAAILLAAITMVAEIKHCATGRKATNTLTNDCETGRRHRFPEEALDNRHRSGKKDPCLAGLCSKNTFSDARQH